ncbi:hypothetical protein [Streptomyces sp. KR80]|uniref:hypothetical protein n=1 Tax=Streptomyces sp. KR80 TaxID=3457426 RepID=UPI003FCFA5B7
MTALCFADAGEAADVAAFLARLLHYDRRSAVRLQDGGRVLAVFGRPASFEVLAIRTARLATVVAPRGQEGSVGLDVTVSAGQLADAIDAARTTAEGPEAPAVTVTLPEPVTGPPWAGVLPPRRGWERVEGLPSTADVRGAVGAAVAEFRLRTEALPEQRRTRAELDRIGREIWSRTLGDTELPLRAVHAAQSLGFLRPLPAGAAAARTAAAPGPRGNGSVTALASPPPEPLALLAVGRWLRLRTPYGSIAVRRAGQQGLTVTPA